MARRLRLNTPVNARKTLSRLIRLVDSGEIQDGRFRTLVYGMAKLLEYFRFEKDLEIEARLTEIERRLKI